MRLTPDRRSFLALAVALASQSLPARSQQQPSVMLVEPAPPLLTKQFGAWQQSATDSDTTPPADPALQTILKEDGLTRSAVSTYTRAASSETLDLQAYQFIDATGAFSAFTYFRVPEDHPVAGQNLGAASVEHGETMLIWYGPSVVRAQFHGAHHTSDLAGLVDTLPRIGGPKGDPPLLPTLLPAKGLLSDSLKYALGPESYQAMGGILPSSIVGFDKSAEVVTAKYSGRGVLTLLLYPTPQIAGEHGRQIEAEMNHEGSAAGTVKLRREGELVLLTSGTWPAEEAKRVVDEIHLSSELTWNKPVPLEFHAEVRKTASLLVGIIELSAVLMIAAIVLGLFFGGGRAMVRILQGKPAAAEPEFLTIDLRDRSGDKGSFKPLH